SHALVGGFCEPSAGSVAFAHENHAERAIFQHSRESSLALANGERLLVVIPTKSDGRVRARLVVVRIVLVLIEREIAISAAIHANLQWIGGLLGGVLLLRAKRQNRPGTDEKRQALQRGGSINSLPTLRQRASPKVVPARGRQIHVPSRCTGFRHGAHQQRRPKQ